MSTFQIIFTPTSAAELARMPKELQLQILGDFRGLPQHVIASDLEDFGKLLKVPKALDGCSARLIFCSVLFAG